MTNTDRVRDFLHGIAPADASNSEISARTGIKPHTQVFIITRSLADRGEIDGFRAGHEWRFRWGQGSRRVKVSPSLSASVVPTKGTAPDDILGWDSASESEGRLGLIWQPLGRLLLNENRLESPRVPSAPGLYRFRLRNNSAEARYIGETENLARRFALYRSPGPLQQTNLRLNGVFRTALASGAEIGVAVVTDNAWIEIDGCRAPPDFSKKAVRRLFENWAIVEGSGEPVESLNR
jgi:hypothetical protein